MKKFFTLLVFAVISTTAFAQPPSAMKFAGPSTFGVASLNAWQDNETDTIVFKMNSIVDADITLPNMTYNAMGVTIPSFTIHGAKFTYEVSTGNSVFADQTYTETAVVNGETKTYNGTSFTGTYYSATKTFVINTTLLYGNMMFPVTYKINAAYVVPTGIEEVVSAQNDNDDVIFDTTGKKVNKPVKGQVYISKGKKFIAQ